MLLTSLPFDYVKLLDTGDRVRTPRKRTGEIRVRRAPKREKG
jgi:hypothetical protein